MPVALLLILAFLAAADATGRVTHLGSGQVEIRATYGYHPSSIYVEGTPLLEMQIDDTRSYTRSGNDTNNNAADFLLRSRTPLNSGSSCTIR